ncbi:MAG: hypothetical protein ABIP21_05540, partial [Acidimicrobiia bacterium]
DWSEGSFHALSRDELTLETHDASTFVISGRHRLGPAALASWLTRFGRNVGATPAAGFGRRRDPAWVRVYKLARFDPGSVPSIVTVAALQQMSDPRVAGLREIVLAGDPASLAAARQRMQSVGAPEPVLLVASAS